LRTKHFDSELALALAVATFARNKPTVTFLLYQEGMAERRKSPSSRRVQYAAFPYRVKRKRLEVMLVTSRGGRRWIIPKGWPKRGTTPQTTAAEEAFEEAGVLGKVAKRPIGSYSYDKILKTGDAKRCKVRVFALEVKRQRKKWPEMQERQVEWYRPAEATQFVQDPRLRRIIKKFAKRR